MSWKRSNQFTNLGGLGELWSPLQKGHKVCVSLINKKNRIFTRTFLDHPFRYYAITDEVLTSVKRTEESLMKLKQSRKSSTLMADVSSGMSDDNKIRLQLAMDIEQYSRKVSGNSSTCPAFMADLNVRVTTTHSITFLPTEIFYFHCYLIPM